MNPFEDLIKQVQQKQPEIASALIVEIGDYYLDTSLLLTDDLAAIFKHFIKDKNMIGDLVKYSDQLPYSVKIDLMYYLGEDKKLFKKLKKIKVFDNFVDAFAASIANLKA